MKWVYIIILSPIKEDLIATGITKTEIADKKIF